MNKHINPDHYSGYAMEPAKFIMMNGLPFWLGNIIKYSMRAGKKEYDGMSALESEKTDLLKAREYINMRIEYLEFLECQK